VVGFALTGTERLALAETEDIGNSLTHQQQTLTFTACLQNSVPRSPRPFSCCFLFMVPQKLADSFGNLTADL